MIAKEGDMLKMGSFGRWQHSDHRVGLLPVRDYTICRLEQQQQKKHNLKVKS